MSHANSVRLVTEVQAKNSERFLYITFYATHCWGARNFLGPVCGMVHFCGEVTGYVHVFAFAPLYFNFIRHFPPFAWDISWGRDAAVTFALQLTRLQFSPLSPSFPCFPHYPLYISNYTLILNLKHLQTDARFWKSLRYLGNNFPFPIPWGCRNIPRLLGQKSNRPDFLLREPN